MELHSGLSKARLLLAEIYLREGKADWARQECETVLSSEPQNYQAKLLLGNSCIAQKMLGEAMAAYKDLIKLQPSNPTGYFRIGLVQRLNMEYISALENFKKASSFNPRLIDVFTNIIFLHASLKEYDIALQKCDRQMELMKDTPKALGIIHNMKGELHFVLNELSTARLSFEKALELNPNLITPYYSLAKIHFADGRQEKAIAQYKAALEIYPRKAGFHMAIGTIYDRLKQFDHAEQQYRKALEINPDFAPAANNLANLLAIHGTKLDEAMDLARKAKEKLPGDPSVMDTLGLIYYKKGLYDWAKAEFRDSLEINPDKATINYHLGMTYFRKEENDLAKTFLKRALDMNDQFDGADEARKILAEL